MNDQEHNIDKSSSRRNGALVFYHPNGKVQGAAARFELRLNRRDEDCYDCFFLEMARQKSARSRGSHATFDWQNKITVKLGFTDICEFLAVLEGLADAAGGRRQSLYHQNNGSSTLIAFKRRDTGSGFFLGLSKKSHSGDLHRKISMALSPAEAIGLKHVFQSGIFHMAFHGSLAP